MKKNIFSSVWGRIGYGLLSLLLLGFVLACFAVGAPQGAILASAGVSFPFGAADLKQPAYAATLAVTITETFTILDPAILTGAMTINLTIDSKVMIGAMLFMEITATATEVTTFGTGLTALTVTGVAGKTKCVLFIYDGTTFKPSAVAFQID